MKHIITNKAMYHVSHVINRESILKNGLDPTLGHTPWPEDKYPDGTYLFDDIKKARSYGFGNGDPFDIWEVWVWSYDFKDDPITKGAFYIEGKVSKEHIELVESHETDVTNSI